MSEWVIGEDGEEMVFETKEEAVAAAMRDVGVGGRVLIHRDGHGREHDPGDGCWCYPEWVTSFFV